MAVKIFHHQQNMFVQTLRNFSGITWQVCTIINRPFVHVNSMGVKECVWACLSHPLFITNKITAVVNSWLTDVLKEWHFLVKSHLSYENIESNWIQVNLENLFSSLNESRPTYCISFTEAPGDHIVHVAVFTELQLRQVHLHLAVLHKHTLFHHLEKNMCMYL